MTDQERMELQILQAELQAVVLAMREHNIQAKTQGRMIPANIIAQATQSLMRVEVLTRRAASPPPKPVFRKM